MSHTIVQESAMPFVNEPVPSDFIASFDLRRLRGEGGLGSVPNNPQFRWGRWTIDKDLDAALIFVGDNEMTRRTVDDTPPRRDFYALLWKGRVITFEATTGAYGIEGSGVAPGTERTYEIKYWRDTDIWLDDDLIEQLPEVLAATREAYYVRRGWSEQPWVRGVEIRIRSINDVAVGEVGS
ncbi:MAG: hypothetical protein R3E99_14465 [Burkholderiaceae bacterium]